MRKLSRRGFKTFVWCHLPTIIAVPIALLAAGGLLFWYSSYTDAKIVTMNSNNATLLASLDKQIAAIKAQKLKEKQEAAAKATADQAQTADGSTASTVDSSTCNLSKTHNDPASIDVLVNKKHCIQPVTYAPDDLVTVYDSNGNAFLLSAKAAPSFKAMSDAAAAAGQSFYLTSSYRSYSEQVSTYAYWVKTSGTAGADTYSARPGYSEHQTGFAFDVAANGHVLNEFGSTSQYQWLLAHASDYGFIQRYYAGKEAITGYEAEEWHYRYVGVDVAHDMQANGIKTLEEYWHMTGGDYY